MTTIRTLNDDEKRLVIAVKEKMDNPSVSVRELVRKHQVKRTKLQRALLTDGTPKAILAMSDGRGRANRLNSDEEKMICEVVNEFSHNGTPLSRHCVLDVAQTLVLSLPSARQSKIGFNEMRPGEHWLRNFLKRYPNLKLKTRTNLEQVRAEAMNPSTVAKHFARIVALCEHYEIRDASQMFNLDETGFSIKGMRTGGRTKCVVPKNARANSRDVTFRGSIDHVTFMPVVSASGQLYTPVCVLPGVEAKYRKTQRGYETPSDYLPSPHYLYMRAIAGVDSNIFFDWAKNFVDETAHLRRNNRYLLLIFDGYGCHLQYNSLKFLKDNNIVVAGLPAHTSHALQPLDVGVFRAFKEAFKKLLGKRSAHTSKSARNDVFTICELLTRAYHQSVVATNIISGFERTGLWVSANRGPDPSKIRAEDLTSSEVNATELNTFPSTRSVTSIVESSGNRESKIENYRQLYELFSKRAEQLRSDGAIVLENGTVKVSTTTGASLTSDNVISALKAVHERKEKEALEKQKRTELKEKRKAERALELARQEVRRSEAEERALLVLSRKRNRSTMREELKRTRKARRLHAASRAEARAPTS